MPTRIRMTAALCTGFLMAAVVTDVAAVAAGARRLRLLDRLLVDVDAVSDAELARNDDLVVATTVAQLVVFLITAVTIGALRSETRFSMLGDALFVVAGVLAVLVVVGLTTRTVQQLTGPEA